MNKPATQAAPKARRSVTLTLIAITLVAISGLFVASQTYFRNLEIESAKSRVSLYNRSLNDTISRFRHLPPILARYRVIINAATGGEIASTNAVLADFARQSELEAIYLMNMDGLVISSSNFDQPQSFMGQNYAFRPYFRAALDGEIGEYFGVGATTGRPGYFLSNPVRDALGAIIGVINIKLDMSELQRAWEDGGELVLTSNTDDVIILSSNADLLYQTLGELVPAKRKTILESRQFGSQTLTAIDWHRTDTAEISLSGENFLYAAIQSEGNGWTVHYLLSKSRIFERAWLTTGIFGALLAALLGFATYLRSVRIENALNESLIDRENLRATNTELEKTQKELSQKSKLAALGELSASVTHELGQPISAMRNYLVAAEISGAGVHRETFARLSKVVERMEGITKQLRFFTKPGNDTFDIVEAHAFIAEAVGLFDYELKNTNTRITLDVPTSGLPVCGDNLRLEQVFVNLLKNSIFAVSDVSNPEIEITAVKKGDQVHISVRDNGSGFGERQLEDMQEPFHTTRPSGDGMGLGLAISAAIIKEHGGELSAENLEDGGAVFVVMLPISGQTEPI